MSLLGKRGESNIRGGVGISSGISSFTYSGSVVMSSADANSGDNDGNTDDATAINIIDDGDDIRKNDVPNTHLSHNNTTITVHGEGHQTKTEQSVMTEHFLETVLTLYYLTFMLNRKMTSITILMLMMPAQPGFLRLFNTNSITRLQHGF